MRSQLNKTVHVGPDLSDPRISRVRLASLPKRRGNARARLLAAAADLLCAHGYFTVTVDNIAAAAEVSRVTFYRHFSDKSAITAELYRQVTAIAVPRYASIGTRDYRDPNAVASWIRAIFAADAKEPLIHTFTQALVEAPEFLVQAQHFNEQLIEALAADIPAFRIDQSSPGGRRQWLEAWLLVYHILDQSNHAVRGSNIATDPQMIDILTDEFLEFVGRYS